MKSKQNAEYFSIIFSRYPLYSPEHEYIRSGDIYTIITNRGRILDAQFTDGGWDPIRNRFKWFEYVILFAKNRMEDY